MSTHQFSAETMLSLGSRNFVLCDVFYVIQTKAIYSLEHVACTVPFSHCGLMLYYSHATRGIPTGGYASGPRSLLLCSKVKHCFAHEKGRCLCLSEMLLSAGQYEGRTARPLPHQKSPFLLLQFQSPRGASQLLQGPSAQFCLQKTSPAEAWWFASGVC
jgi:hypothetical protein